MDGEILKQLALSEAEKLSSYQPLEKQYKDNQKTTVAGGVKKVSFLTLAILLTL